MVEGNRIGTDAAAAVDQGNVENGVRITGAPSNKIGGTALGEGNVISGNDQNGVRIDDAGATGNTVEGNWIGTNDAGASLGNGLEGVFTINGAEGNAIGGADPGAGNVIAFNGANGVQPTGTGNPILGNSIDSNVELGIDLPGGTEDAFGVTQNDAGDADVGANDLQNHPVISWVAGGSTAVAGKLSSEPNSSYRLEFFSSPGADHRCSVRERRSWAPRW